jgi:hypothetical protein
VSLLWAVPVVAMAVAVGVVLSRLRAIEDLCVDLARSVRRTNELRPPIVAARRELNRSAPLVERVWSHWDDGAADGAENSPADP